MCILSLVCLNQKTEYDVRISSWSSDVCSSDLHISLKWAAYTALEGDVTDWFSLGLAARYEDFSDFGSAFTWKVNGRVEFSDAIAIRGSVNTGFRAPTPGQSNVSSTFANIDAITGAPFITGIVSPSNPVAQLFGAQPLEREKSFRSEERRVGKRGDS